MNSLKTALTLPPYTRKEEICNIVTAIVLGAFGIYLVVLCFVLSNFSGHMISMDRFSVYG